MPPPNGLEYSPNIATDQEISVLTLSYPTQLPMSVTTGQLLRHTASRTLDTFKAMHERDAMARARALRTIQAWLGQKSLETTQIYLGVQDSDKLKDNVNAAFGRATTGRATSANFET